MIQQCMTAQQFLQQRPDLPEAGQWAELVQGAVVLQEPPDLDHGTVVLNLSKRLAEYYGQGGVGYACFDLGLHLERSPDTVLFPAISLYLSGERFAQTDKELTEAVPDLVVEIVSTAQRRQRSEEKLKRYHAWGVQSEWFINSRAQDVVLAPATAASQRLSVREILCDPLLPGFVMPVVQLFAEPEWYRGSR